MTDRPILFSAPMVRALLEGRKTQTRRLATSPLRRCEVGDRLWVKETWARDDLIDTGARYYATDNVSDLRKKRVSIHMPRWASRITLAVEAVRFEQLQDITEQDAIAEGAARLVYDGEGAFFANDEGTFRCGFAGLWEHLHGRNGHGWDDNPDVVALTFRVLRGNIDRVCG